MSAETLVDSCAILLLLCALLCTQLCYAYVPTCNLCDTWQFAAHLHKSPAAAQQHACMLCVIWLSKCIASPLQQHACTTIKLGCASCPEHTPHLHFLSLQCRVCCRTCLSLLCLLLAWALLPCTVAFPLTTIFSCITQQNGLGLCIQQCYTSYIHTFHTLT